MSVELEHTHVQPLSQRAYRLHVGDALTVMAEMPDESVDCVVTSPPYWGMRDYGIAGQYGLEPTVEQYVDRLRAVFAEARRLLAADGTLWLNLGDVYGGSWNNYLATGSTAPSGREPRRQHRGHHFPPQSTQRPKNLLGVPWRVALALTEDGWTLRNAVVWHKPNPMPESVRDRLATSYELVFLFARSRRYWFDLDAIREPPMGRNPGDVWSIPTRPCRGTHFAVGPIDIPMRCIAAGCKPAGMVLDPFSGSGTTGAAALTLGRRFTGIDLNPAFHMLARRRFKELA